MNKIYFTPGPSQLFYTVDEHIKQALKLQVPSISHRGKEFKNIYAHTDTQLRTLLSLPDNYQVLFTNSATEIWERTIQNCVNEHSYHLVNGAFSDKFYQTAKLLGKDASKVEATEGSAVRLDDVHISPEVELIGLAHNETSTGVTQPLSDIYELRDKYPDPLIAVDVVSSIPYVAIDYDKVDMVYFSVQKCFGLPAGLGVWLVNDRTIAKARTMASNGLHIAKYRQILAMVDEAARFQTTSTPNVLDIYLLGKVAEDMNAKGLDMIRRETNYKAAVLYHCINEHPKLEAFIQDSEYQSKTTVVAKTDGSPKDFIEPLEKLGLVIGSGYAKYKDEHIRIANFPTHSNEQIELLVDQLNKL
jgi:phosphoserine aminotransferase